MENAGATVWEAASVQLRAELSLLANNLKQDMQQTRQASALPKVRTWSSESLPMGRTDVTDGRAGLEASWKAAEDPV
eukprot:6477789-Amphidinium_carterae.2